MRTILLPVSYQQHLPRTASSHRSLSCAGSLPGGRFHLQDLRSRWWHPALRGFSASPSPTSACPRFSSHTLHPRGASSGALPVPPGRALLLPPWTLSPGLGVHLQPDGRRGGPLRAAGTFSASCCTGASGLFLHRWAWKSRVFFWRNGRDLLDSDLEIPAFVWSDEFWTIGVRGFLLFSAFCRNWGTWGELARESRCSSRRGLGTARPLSRCAHSSVSFLKESLVVILWLSAFWYKLQVHVEKRKSQSFPLDWLWVNLCWGRWRKNFLLKCIILLWMYSFSWKDRLSPFHVICSWLPSLFCSKPIRCLLSLRRAPNLQSACEAQMLWVVPLSPVLWFLSDNLPLPSHFPPHRSPSWMGACRHSLTSWPCTSLSLRLRSSVRLPVF